MSTDSKPIVFTSNADTRPQSSISSFFIVRPSGNGGAIVPLIPYDELPASITLAGISRSLELEDTIGMTNLGLVRARDTVHVIVESGETKLTQDKVEKKNPTVDISILSKRPVPPQKPHLGPLKTNLPIVPLLTTATSNNSTNTNTTTYSINSGTHAPHSSPRSPTSISTVSTPPSPHFLSVPLSNHTHATPSRQICRHWLHHGTCKWAPYCRYEHRMPDTVRGLVANGLRAWPAWWVVENEGQVGGVALQSGRQVGVGRGYGCGRGGLVQRCGGAADRLLEGKTGVRIECCGGCGVSGAGRQRRGGIVENMEERGRKEWGMMEKVQRVGLKGGEKRVEKTKVAEKEKQKQIVSDKATLEGQVTGLEEIVEKLQVGKGAVQVEKAVATEKYRLVEQGRLVDV